MSTGEAMCWCCDLPLTERPRDTCTRPHHWRLGMPTQCSKPDLHRPHGGCPGLDGTEHDRAANLPR